MEAIQETVRRRILRWFRRQGLLEEHTVREMLGWDHAGGFSLDASLRIAAPDRAGLERLLRYCARPLICPECGESMRLIAFLTDPLSIREVLDHLGEPLRPVPAAEVTPIGSNQALHSPSRANPRRSTLVLELIGAPALGAGGRQEPA